MHYNYVSDMKNSINSYTVLFKEIIESDIGVDYKIYPNNNNKEKDKIFSIALHNTSKKEEYNKTLEYSLLIDDIIKLKKLLDSYRKKDLHSKVIFLLEELEKIDSIANDNTYNNDIYINVVAFFEGKLIYIRDNKCCININNKNVIFPLETEEANNWYAYLNKPVKIYAEVKKDMNGEIIEGIDILKLEPIEILDKDKVEKDFYDLMKELNVNNLTRIIIDMRHKDD